MLSIVRRRVYKLTIVCIIKKVRARIKFGTFKILSDCVHNFYDKLIQEIAQSPQALHVAKLYSPHKLYTLLSFTVPTSFTRCYSFYGQVFPSPNKLYTLL